MFSEPFGLHFGPKIDQTSMKKRCWNRRRRRVGKRSVEVPISIEILTPRILKNREITLVFSSENESPPFRFQAPTDKTKHEK